MINKNKFKILLAPTFEQADTIKADATVEAEYGDLCIAGSKIALAHHGSRSNNPAPCNTNVTPLEKGTILLSHIDLDAIGGCLAVMGEKYEDKDFWKAAEYIDINGTHHIHDFSKDIQEKLNAFYCWNNTKERIRYSEITDVTNIIEENKNVLNIILDERHPEHDDYIKKGIEWEKDISSAVESKLFKETDSYRAFITDGVFCAASYYSPKDDEIKPATITLNTKFNSITIAFEDGGKKCSAREIVQSLWGNEAGGRDGIAGSPRNWNKSERQLSEAFSDAILKVDEIVRKHYDLSRGIQDKNIKDIDDMEL